LYAAGCEIEASWTHAEWEENSAGDIISISCRPAVQF
jgi:hypothetical protein